MSRQCFANTIVPYFVDALLASLMRITIYISYHRIKLPRLIYVLSYDLNIYLSADLYRLADRSAL